MKEKIKEVYTNLPEMVRKVYERVRYNEFNEDAGTGVGFLIALLTTNIINQEEFNILCDDFDLSSESIMEDYFSNDDSDLEDTEERLSKEDSDDYCDE